MSFATLVLRADAVANAALAAAVLGSRSTLAEAAGLGSTWPLVVLATALGVNAALCWGAARGGAPTPGALRGLAEVDLVFTIAVAGFVLADPAGAAPWLRVVLGTLAAVVASVAVTKLSLGQAVREHARTG